MSKYLLGLLLLLACGHSNTPVPTNGGAVSTTNTYATQVGYQILRAGGNAFDAAIAIHYALAVSYPRAGNIGGGGFALLRTSEGRVEALDFREKAPAAAHASMYLDAAGEHQAQRSLFGALAVGVPGSVAGMDSLFRRYATKPIAELLQPAIDLALEGYVLSADEAATFNRHQADFQRENHQAFPFVRQRPWQQGDTLRQEQLGRTLKRIATHGAADFYRGQIAKQLVEELTQAGGLIGADDLMQYTALWRQPIAFRYRGHQLFCMPPPSSGGVALAQLLGGAEGYPVQQWPQSKRWHLFTELMRRAYADRASHLGDADHYPVPVQHLTDTAYIRSRMASISMHHKTPSDSIRAGKVDRIESFETTHYAVADRWGNVVSITTTLNGNFGSKLYLSGLGFFLNNEMDDFSSKPGVPNQFGLVGAQANAIAPGKRMLSSMSPSLAVDSHGNVLALGSPGGATIISSVFQVLVRWIDDQMSLQQAIDHTRMHAQWQPDVVVLEQGRVPDSIVNRLTSLGHKVEWTTALGRINAVVWKPNGDFEAAADTARSDGTAIVF